MTLAFSSLITYLTDKPNIFGTILFLPFLMLMLVLDRALFFHLFYLYFIFVMSLNLLLWDTWTLTIFIFIFLFFYFSDFVLIFFFFSFLFLLDDEEAHDTAVTWQVTWCDIISLEHGGRVWKMMSGHMYTTWWPWVENEVDMR